MLDFFFWILIEHFFRKLTTKCRTELYAEIELYEKICWIKIWKLLLKNRTELKKETELDVETEILKNRTTYKKQIRCWKLNVHNWTKLTKIF